MVTTPDGVFAIIACFGLLYYCAIAVRLYVVERVFFNFDYFEFFDYFEYLVPLGVLLRVRRTVVGGGWLICASTCVGILVVARSSC